MVGFPQVIDQMKKGGEVRGEQSRDSISRGQGGASSVSKGDWEDFVLRYILGSTNAHNDSRGPYSFHMGALDFTKGKL